MKKHICLLLFIISVVFTKGQTFPPRDYAHYIKIADSLYDSKDYKNSALNYSKAFEAFGWKGYERDRYNAACSWALAGNSDSAFFMLQRITDTVSFSNYNRVIADEDLIGLHNDERWEKLILQIKSNEDKKNEGLDLPLLHLLDSMKKEDQKWRVNMRKYRNGELSDDTTLFQSIINKIKLIDSLNYYQLKNIFSNYGFPNYDQVGQNGSHDFWLLVQHQDRHPGFQDSVLAKMKIEVDLKKAAAINYAYLLDRVRVNSGEKQVYGTQCMLNEDKTSYIPQPVIDPEKLNERRLSIGLDSIENYIEGMNRSYFGNLKKD